jgi:sugar/nucleoside kinase (ribokinase family)
MSLAAVGSIAFDTVRSPFGEVEAELGGSAVYAAMAAAVFTEAAIVGPVGADFEDAHYDRLTAAGVQVEGIDRAPGADTFAWRGHYDFDMVARTEETRLNVFDGWRPRLSAAARNADILFLGAMDPEVQLDVRGQWSGAKWVALDTLGYWIAQRRDALREAIAAVDLVLLDDLEARELTGRPMLLAAAREIMGWGPRAVVLRLGEYGCALLTPDGYFSLPGYPLEDAADPTGCGDAFAGGFLGYLDRVPGERLTQEVLRRAVTYGLVMSSYCYEDFGVRRIAGLTEREVDYRFADFRAMTHFEHVPTRPRAREGGEDGNGRLSHPGLTPSTQPLRAPGRTPSTQGHRSPARTPGTEPPPRPQRAPSSRLPSSAGLGRPAGRRPRRRP